jgi:hypothetical protein
MPRNHYTKVIRKSEHTQLARQEKELINLIRQLRRGIATSIELPVSMTAKQRRSARLAQKREHRPSRQPDTPEIRAA